MTITLAKAREQEINRAVETYSNRLFRFVRARVPSVADAEDVLQDVWLQFSRVMQVESIEQVSGWLFRVARNRITDLYRRTQPDLLEDLQSRGEDGTFIRDILIADPQSPEEAELNKLFWEVLFEALEELPEKQRQAFVWNELEDKTFQEMSDDTGESIKTWISRKRYAVSFLRERLQDLYKEFEF